MFKITKKIQFFSIAMGLKGPKQESLNDREIGELNEQILEENNKNEENQQEFENNDIEMGINQENLGYFNSLNAHGTGRGKWIGMKVDFGDTV